MSTEIIVALVTSVFTFAGVVLTVVFGNKKTSAQIKAQTDLTVYRIEQLEIKQDKHNTLIERMYKVEDEINILGEKVKVANHRIDDLEHKGV